MYLFRKPVLYILALLPFWAGAQTPSEVVRRGNAEVEKLLHAKADAEALAQSIEGFVDFGELAKRALGDKWKGLSKKQQAEFAQTMKGLLKAAYVQKTARGSPSNLSNAQLEREELRTTEACVYASLQSGKTRLPVEYRLHKTKAGWRVFDIVTDEVSLLQTYEEQFRKFLSQRSYEELLKTLKAKREQLEQTEKKDQGRVAGGGMGAGELQGQ
ncbi:MAG: ABC transporter substrate-binding protein [Proteobacteria bacterium]|nr:ABC transporter substrate-binding protein [Cystobacterineae bacterium]MCL2258428.1 ABC transporter substrate-binding protein [Cystobacterineae bacterium]MCL2315220.1 ABC transporter substrate-binding protein [Pseudomonadota bacterium]